MTTISSPVVQLPIPQIYNLVPTWVSNTSLTVSAGYAWDSTFTYSLTVPSTLTLDATTVGANGLDTGSLGASKWYYLYVIGDATGFNTPKLLLSLSATAPYMPAGTSESTTYNIMRLIGIWPTDSSSHLINATVVGKSNDRTLYYDTKIAALTAGTSATYAAVDLSASVPPIAFTPVTFNSQFTPNAAADVASLRPTGSSATSDLTITGVVAAKAQGGQIKLLSNLASSVAKIDYLVTASGSLTLAVLSFDYYI